MMPYLQVLTDPPANPMDSASTVDLDWNSSASRRYPTTDQTMALPVPALFAIVWSVVGYLREANELQSKSTVEALAIGFAGGSVTTFTYGLMQFVGAPQLNWTWVWAVYALWWIAGGIIVRRRYN